MEEGIAPIHGGAVTVEGRDGAVFEQVADVEELLVGQTVLLACLGVWGYIVELAELGGEGDVSGVVETGVGEFDDTVLRWSIASQGSVVLLGFMM